MLFFLIQPFFIFSISIARYNVYILQNKPPSYYLLSILEVHASLFAILSPFFGDKSKGVPSLRFLTYVCSPGALQSPDCQLKMTKTSRICGPPHRKSRLRVREKIRACAFLSRHSETKKRFGMTGIRTLDL